MQADGESDPGPDGNEEEQTREEDRAALDGDPGPRMNAS